MNRFEFGYYEECLITKTHFFNRHRMWQASVNDLKIPQKEMLFERSEFYFF